MPPEAKREHLIAYLADIILVSQAADSKKLGEHADFKRRQAFARNKLLMGTCCRTQAKAAVTEEAMHKVYDEAVKPMAGEEEVRARHILVETEDEAKAILASSRGGADFAALAKEKSKDPGGADGGDLGYFTKDQMVPEFSEVAFKMDRASCPNPVKTQFGWHIIKVEDKRKQPAAGIRKGQGPDRRTSIAQARRPSSSRKLRAGRQDRASRPSGGRARRHTAGNSAGASASGCGCNLRAVASRSIVLSGRNWP